MMLANREVKEGCQCPPEDVKRTRLGGGYAGMLNCVGLLPNLAR